MGADGLGMGMGAFIFSSHDSTTLHGRKTWVGQRCPKNSEKLASSSKYRSMPSSGCSSPNTRSAPLMREMRSSANAKLTSRTPPRRISKLSRERECCLLVLNLVSSTLLLQLPCIRQPRPRLVHVACHRRLYRQIALQALLVGGVAQDGWNRAVLSRGSRCPHASLPPSSAISISSLSRTFAHHVEFLWKVQVNLRSAQAVNGLKLVVGKVLVRAPDSGLR